MGLIKRYQVEENGVLELDRPEALTTRAEPVVSGPTDLEMQQQALQMNVGRAKSEAEKIIIKAQGEAEMIRSKARDAGRTEGRAESGLKIEEALETLNQAVMERKKIIKDAEGEILRLSIKIAEQIIKSEVSLHRDVSLNIVAEAIARVSDREQIIVKASRDDAEYLKRYKDRLAGMLDGVKSFSIIEDSSIEPGGCIIETNLGFIDAKIATKLESIEAALKHVTSDQED